MLDPSSQELLSSIANVCMPNSPCCSFWIIYTSINFDVSISLSCVYSSNSLSNLWALLHSLQMITYMAFLHINLLDHVVILFDMLMISHFDIIPFRDAIYKSIYRHHETFIPVSGNFQIFGYDYSLAFLNLGNTYLVFIIMTGVWILYKALGLVLAKLKTTRLLWLQK